MSSDKKTNFFGLNFILILSKSIFKLGSFFIIFFSSNELNLFVSYPINVNKWW